MVIKCLCHKILFVIVLSQTVFLGSTAYAGFPDDLSDVVFLHNDISSWPVTSSLSVNIRGGIISMPYDKANVWPSINHQFCSGCNANPWIIVNFSGTWYAATFEWFRFNQIEKPVRVVHGDHIKRAPFGATWTPKNGETYGFMVSGLARVNDGIISARERTNLVLYKWGQGPVDVIDNDPIVPPPVSNTHVYNGSAIGTLTGTLAGDPFLIDINETVNLVVGNDRSLTMQIEGESFSTTLNSRGAFSATVPIAIVSGCEPLVTINGVIEGVRATGSLNGSAECLGDTVLLNATFTAVSTTEPVFEEVNHPSLTPVYQLLFE